MTAEQIVRALAAADPVVMRSDGYLRCGLCTVNGFSPLPAEKHWDDCPWRLAVEWVAEQDGPRANPTKVALAVREAVADHRAGKPLAFPPQPPRRDQ